MSWLDKVTPINLLEEKEKFFADQTYNPQFIFTEPIDQDTLYRYGLPKKEYLDLAKEILDKTYFGRNEKDLIMLEGPILSQNEVNHKFTTFLKMHKLEERFSIVWSTAFTSRASINKNTIKLRNNAEFRKDGTIGLIYHEIGTHALRRINYEKQPWYRKKNEFGLTTDYLRTEEGLAALHSLLPKTFFSAFNSAIRYLAIHYSQNFSFSELWQYIGAYIQDRETRWMVTFRQKRGLTDTSQPGGMTKDLVYFEGMIEVWRWLRDNEYNPTNLYYGKIAHEDSAQAAAISSNNILLPSFYTLSQEIYKQKMEIIGLFNNF